jgi:hypothetical protein
MHTLMQQVLFVIFWALGGTNLFLSRFTLIGMHVRTVRSA